MKRFVILITILTNAGFANATVLSDGAVHDIDYIVSSYLQIFGTTTVNVYDGGGTESFISAHDSAELNIFDGTFGENITVRDNAVATIYGGAFGKNKYVDVSIVVNEQSSTIIYGGTYSSGILLYGYPDDSPTLEFHGTDFYIGGQSVFGLIDPEELFLTGAMSKTINGSYLTYYGVLTGTLEDGSILNNELEMRSFLSGNHANLFVIPKPSIQQIITFINSSVTDGTLEGVGGAPDKKIEALIKILESAGELIEAENYDKACKQLEVVLKKCDGQDLPPDFVTGTAAEELAEKITELMEYIGCQEN